MQFIIGIVTGFILFTVIYFVVPNRKQTLIKVLPGALLAGFLFELVTLLFPAYIALTNSVATYGKEFGLFFLLMTFFFFFGLITMIGVEVDSVIFPESTGSPGKDRQGAAPESGPTGKHRQAATNGQRSNGRHGIPARAALGMAVVASVVGVLLGRRRGNSG